MRVGDGRIRVREELHRHRKRREKEGREGEREEGGRDALSPVVRCRRR
jgi:hypothetical protein